MNTKIYEDVVYRGCRECGQMVYTVVQVILPICSNCYLKQRKIRK